MLKTVICQLTQNTSSATTTGMVSRMTICKCCGAFKFVTKCKRKLFTLGMPRAAGILLALILTTLLNTVSARGIPGSPSIEESQDVYRLIDNIQERDPKSLTYMKELAIMLDKLKQQPLDSLSEQSEELLPIPQAMQGRPLPSMQEGPREDKRGSYMSLCHFKICNMGRKRGYWNPWNRT
ncbi:CNMamide [Lycorma delicatula]|uniref:CNMamide n=1 Tax=Lycorma delicatula TaxID=130591 RepID=UPI003F51657A